ncbi:hypothetical protein E2542_SST18812 [Spatholobus suberectus]|nr:hypothetical protein E2542_SST18812 [Spatholobus suberectus]
MEVDISDSMEVQLWICELRQGKGGDKRTNWLFARISRYEGTFTRLNLNAYIPFYLLLLLYCQEHRYWSIQICPRLQRTTVMLGLNPLKAKVNNGGFRSKSACAHSGDAWEQRLCSCSCLQTIIVWLFLLTTTTMDC